MVTNIKEDAAEAKDNRIECVVKKASELTHKGQATTNGQKIRLRPDLAKRLKEKGIIE